MNGKPTEMHDFSIASSSVNQGKTKAIYLKTLVLKPSKSCCSYFFYISANFACLLPPPFLLSFIVFPSFSLSLPSPLCLSLSFKCFAPSPSILAEAGDNEMSAEEATFISKGLVK